MRILIWSILLFTNLSVAGPTAFDIARNADAVKLRAEYALREWEAVQEQAGNTKVKMNKQVAYLMAPLNDQLSLVPQARITNIDSLANIPATGLAIPKQFVEAKMLMVYKKLFKGNTAFGGNATIGTASNQPFKHTDDMVFESMIYYNLGTSNTNHFLAFIEFSNNRPYFSGIPLPGIAIALNLSPRWGTLIGFPYFSLWIFPTDSIHFVWNVNSLQFKSDAVLSLGISGGFSFFGKFENDVSSLMRAGRVDKAQRIYHETREVMAGFEMNVAGKFIMQLSGGYSLLNSLAEVNNFVDRGSSPARMANGFLGQFGIKAAL